MAKENLEKWLINIRNTFKEDVVINILVTDKSIKLLAAHSYNQDFETDVEPDHNQAKPLFDIKGVGYIG